MIYKYTGYSLENQKVLYGGCATAFLRHPSRGNRSAESEKQKLSKTGRQAKRRRLSGEH